MECKIREVPIKFKEICNIQISAQGQILMLNGNSSNVSLEGEINVLGAATISKG